MKCMKMFQKCQEQNFSVIVRIKLNRWLAVEIIY